jgi:hypothetical protein
MNLITKLAVTALFGLAVATTTASADVAKGQKAFSKMLKAPCGMTGAKFAAKHTEDQWEAIGVKGMVAETKKICPKATLKPTLAKDIFDFSMEYASDSGNVPSC